MSAVATPTSLTTVHLVGSLGRAMGRAEWNLDVKSVAEAIRAIDINTKGRLAAYLSGPAAQRNYRVALQKRENVIDPKEATHRSGRSTIYIMPTIRGRDSGVGKVIAGIGLIALAFTGAGALLGSTMYGLMGGTSAALVGGSYVATAGLSMLGYAVAGFGVSLLLGGITQLITPKPPNGQTTAEAQRASTTFPGNATVVVQGGAIPLVYGRMLTPPTPVSITIDNNDVSISDAGTEGGVNTDYLEGGGVQYGPEQ